MYTNRSFYERIYWITAIDQNSLLSDYQKIAERTDLKGLVNTSNTVDIAKGEIPWLIVPDNLDDIAITIDLLPPTDLQRHTLTTTRNPNSKDIPSEGLDVSLFREAEALELLHTLSEDFRRFQNVFRRLQRNSERNERMEIQSE